MSISIIDVLGMQRIAITFKIVWQSLQLLKRKRDSTILALRAVASAKCLSARRANRKNRKALAGVDKGVQLKTLPPEVKQLKKDVKEMTKEMRRLCVRKLFKVS